MLRQWRLASAAVTRAAGNLATGRVVSREVALVVAKLGRPVPKTVEVRLFGQRYAVCHSATRAPTLFRRVRLPATLDLVSGCVGRVESAEQWRLAFTATCTRPAADHAGRRRTVHASPGFRTDRASARLDRRAGSSSRGGLPSQEGRTAQHLALRSDGRLRPGPAFSAFGPCARRSWTGLCPLRKKLASSGGG